MIDCKLVLDLNEDVLFFEVIPGKYICVIPQSSEKECWVTSTWLSPLVRYGESVCFCSTHPDEEEARKIIAEHEDELTEQLAKLEQADRRLIKRQAKYQKEFPMGETVYLQL